MDRVEITPARRLFGEASVPGDKPISHRLALIASVAEGPTQIRNFSPSVDCTNTLNCLETLGVSIGRSGASVLLEGRGFGGLNAPNRELDAGNSGTAARLLMGILAGHTFEASLTGDSSLSQRPMKRVIDPLRLFGARIDARDDGYLPLRIRGGTLRAIQYSLPVASAQVKSAVLLAGLHARGTTHVREPLATRNHTEIALEQFGAQLRVTPDAIEIDGGVPLRGRNVDVPGDLSSAAFLIAGALMVPGSEIRLSGVGVNPTRSGYLAILRKMGARIAVESPEEKGGEPVADIVVRSSELNGLEIDPSWVPNIIDEIPILAVLGTRTKTGITIRGASELRVKESDRIRTIASNLRALGADVEEFPDGITVPGNQALRGGRVESFGDHRIAMAFSVAGLIAQGPVTIEEASCVGISFPGFFDVLRQLRY